MAIVTINPKCKLNKVASKETTRYAIAGTRISGADDCWYADTTDGRCAVRVPVQVVNDSHNITGSILPTQAIIDALKKGATLSVNDKAVVTRGSQTVSHDLLVGTFPNADEVYPKADSGRHQVAINPQLLANMANAMGCEAVLLQIDFVAGKGPDNHCSAAIRVVPHGPAKSISEPLACGVIMPIKIN